MNDYKPLSYAQGKVLRDVARTGQIVPTQARSLDVVIKLGLVEWDGAKFVLTEAGRRRNV